MSRTDSGNALELPDGHSLFSWKPDQVPAPGAIYLAAMPGDLEALFGPVQGLRDREFLLEVDGARWIATPTIDLFMASDEEGTTVFDTGGVNARTDGQQTLIDFELLREAAGYKRAI